MNSSVTVPAVYVGTYHQYNGGSIFGKWFDLTDFDDEDEFYDACRALHAAEDDPELCSRTGKGSRLSLPLNSLFSGRLSRHSGRRRTKDAPPRL
ncbi:anti-restriction protein [Klebsiella michiganensis]|nr:anti-restriction protein [Klebsiella michiganensis]